MVTARYTKAVVDAPGDLMDEYAMLWGLAKRLGTGLPLAGGPCPMDVMPDKAEFLDLMTAGCAVAPSKVRADTPDGAAIIYHDLHPRVEASDPASAARFDLDAGKMPDALGHYAGANATASEFDFKLVSRRTRHRFNSTGGHLAALKAKRTTNPAHIHPDDLAALGIADGALISINSAVGEIVGVAEASPAMRRGIISMAHAFGGTDSDAGNVRSQGVSTNRLVRETIAYDPITGQSLQSAIPVRIASIEV